MDDGKPDQGWAASARSTNLGVLQSSNRLCTVLDGSAYNYDLTGTSVACSMIFRL